VKPLDLLIREITRSDEGARDDELDARLFTDLDVLLELVGMDPSFYREVVAGGLEVLSDGDDVAGVALVVCHGHQVIEHFEDFIFAFADADHDAGFGDPALGFDALEEFHGAFVLRAGTNRWVAAFDGFEVVSDDLGFGIDDHLECGLVAFEVAYEDFDGHVWASLSSPDDGLGPNPGAAVVEIIAIDGGDDDVLEPSASQ